MRSRFFLSDTALARSRENMSRCRFDCVLRFGKDRVAVRDTVRVTVRVGLRFGLRNGFSVLRLGQETAQPTRRLRFRVMVRGRVGLVWVAERYGWDKRRQKPTHSLPRWKETTDERNRASVRSNGFVCVFYPCFGRRRPPIDLDRRRYGKGTTQDYHPSPCYSNAKTKSNAAAQITL